MFDTIGQTPDPERTQRTASAAVLLTSLTGGGVALALLLTAWVTANAVSDIGTEPPPLEEFYEPPLLEVELPETPAPPAARIARGEPDPDPIEEPEPVVPEEMVPPTELTEPPDDAVADAGPPVGDPDGHPDGDPDGEIDGRIDGVPGGTGDQTGGPSAPTVHRSQVRLRRSATPDYPDAAMGMNLGRVDCRVSILIGEDGRPLDSTFGACPAVFRQSVTDAIAQMRWYPYEVGGQRSRARFSIQFVFQPQ